MPATRRATIIPMTTDGLYRLFAWLSASFPTGAFSYSHGLEAEVEAGRVHDRKTLQAWIATMIRHGGGRIDADLLRDAYRGEHVGARGMAYRATAELALESSAQGEAFASTVAAAWAGESHAQSAAAGICHAVAVGAAAAEAGAGLEDALTLYLQSFAGNLMSAGLRLGIVGQTDGQRVLAALEPVIVAAVAACLARDKEAFGTATFAADIASMVHETQYSRLFRS